MLNSRDTHKVPSTGHGFHEVDQKNKQTSQSQLKQTSEIAITDTYCHGSDRVVIITPCSLGVMIK